MALSHYAFADRRNIREFGADFANRVLDGQTVFVAQIANAAGMLNELIGPADLDYRRRNP